MKRKLVVITVFILLLTGCTLSIEQSNVANSKDTVNVSSDSWSVDMQIMFNKIVYVGSDEKVAITEVQEQIGIIENSSDDESFANKENFSNYYPLGTKLYKIKSYSIQDAIAVEIDKDTYVLANIYNN